MIFKVGSLILIRRELMDHKLVVIGSGPASWKASTRRPTSSPAQRDGTLQDLEREHIERVLEQCGWRICGERGAANRLGLKRTTLQSRMKRLGIQRPTV